MLRLGRSTAETNANILNQATYHLSSDVVTKSNSSTFVSTEAAAVVLN